MTLFQKCSAAALISVLLLMFVGAIVRVTGAGMGCPDWPTCWGCLIPPTSVEDVDFDKLPIEKFQRKAERMGRVETITVETLRAEFNARHVWTEFTNRLFSLPVGFFSLAMCILGWGQRRSRPFVFWMAIASLLVVLINAWMGARVVFSGLKPGVLTTHLALAMMLTGMMVYCTWRGTDTPWRVRIGDSQRVVLRWLVGILLVVIVTTGILGAQVREMTDEMAKFHDNAPRETWIGELEQSAMYLWHRSLSWLVLAVAAAAWWVSRTHREGGNGPVEWTAFGIVLAQMVLGVVMSQIHIYSWVQVLHVGLAAVLLTVVWLWWFGLLEHSKASSARVIGGNGSRP
jgi:cytochrome c oxidase assembly protein subunit 15